MGVFMIDMDEAGEVNSPLNMLQCKPATFEGFTDLINSMNEVGPNIAEKYLTTRIANTWPAVEAEVKKVQDADPSDKPPAKDINAKVDELLGLVKSIDGALNDEQSVLQRLSRKRQKQFLNEVEHLLPQKTKTSMQQIAKDLEVLNIDAVISPHVEEQIKQIHKNIIGKFDNTSLSVLDANFNSRD